MGTERVVSLFTGIGAYERALENIGKRINVVNYCEIDKYKSRGYEILHDIPNIKNLWDITKVHPSRVNDCDLVVYSPPCQSFSISGKMGGTKDMRGTLFFNALEIIREKQPKYAVMENVDNLVNSFTEDFDMMLKGLEGAGYNNYWKVINARDFIPQNRNRVYIVSIRKDIDDKTFEFPTGADTRHWLDVINIDDRRGLTARQERMVAVARGQNTEDTIKIEGDIDFESSVITLRQSGLRFQSNREYPTITAHYGKGGGNFTMIGYKGEVFGITPKNCLKLMGFEFEDGDKLDKEKISVSRQYQMAGDSVCVPVLEGIFKNLYKIKSIDKKKNKIYT